MNRTSSSFSIKKGNWNNDAIFPELIYIDTNVVLDIMEQRNFGILSEEYLIELIRRKGMITWSDHLIDEIRDFFHRQVYFKEAEKIGIPTGIRTHAYKWLEDTATDQESSFYSQQVVSKVEKTKQYLEQFGLQNDPDHKEVYKLSEELYKYGSNFQDSKHVAIATLSGTNNILTHDSGFLRYPHTNVLGASKAIVNNYNSITNNTNHFIDLSNVSKIENKLEKLP